MTLSEQEVMGIFDALDKLYPRLTIVKGMNNKTTYYSSDDLWELLRKFIGR